MLGRRLSVVIVAAAVGAVVSAAGPVASAECDPATNLAECATAEASSENASTAQTADKAIDGVADGYPGDYTAEWATIGGMADSTLTLTWPSPQEIGSVVLYDRPNTDDNITGGSLAFDDGSAVMVPALPESGEPLTLEFVPRSTGSLLFTVGSVSPSTYNIGLSEIEVRPAQAIASMLGTTRNFALADSVLQVRPATVATVDAEDPEVRLLRVEFDLEGLGGSSAVGASDFAILDGDGNRYDAVEAPADADVEPLGDHQLETGDTAAGAAYFELPMRARGLLIAYWPAASESAIATWTLSAP